MKKTLFILMTLFISNKGIAQLTYKDVAPIFYRNCTSCHNQYGHGMSFMNYFMTSSSSNAIDNALKTGAMPPWNPDTTYTRFSHERIITQQEKKTILDWLAAGTPKGDTTLAPPAPIYTKYQISAPADLEISIPKFTSNVTTKDIYVCFSVPMGLTEDRIIKAFEIVAGNPSIVHHVICTIDTLGTSTSDLSGECFNLPGDFAIGGIAPGAPPTIFPSVAPLKMGIPIKKGSKMIFQIHYPVGSEGQEDSTKIRLYFYPKNATGIRTVITTSPLQNWLLNIPANTVKTFTATAKFPSTMSVFSTNPHSHRLATKIINYAYKTTDTIPLIRINDWDFEWQGYYVFKRLVKIPSDYTLYSSHTYDNTENNPNASIPPVDVIAGTSTSDEMLFDSFQYLTYQPGDENINIDSLIALDPLSNIIKQQTFGRFKTYAYPNPFKNNVRIGYVLEKASQVTIEIYSMYGTLVRKIETGSQIKGQHEITWDGRTANGAGLAQGTYVYIIKTDTQQSFGKINMLPSSN